MFDNIILNTDSYKASHYLQLPPGTEEQSSYIEARGSDRGWDKAVFFGLQAFLKEYLTKPVTLAMIDEAEQFWATHGEPFNREGWLYILNAHEGYLPVEIRAVAEGTILPNGNVMVEVVNTDPECAWVTSYLETALLRAVWYPTAVATNSYFAKRAIWQALLKSSEDPAGQIAFKLHDFGARGVSSQESAALGGMAHLVNFSGTDTVAGALAARRYYNEPMAGFSIPASEHSTITSWGGPDGEEEAFRNMLARFAKPGSLVACVSDSYDIYHAAEELWGSRLKKDVLESGATLVVRPDSGDPLTVPVEVISILAGKFGYHLNALGYKVLNPAVRVIQGDGITAESLPVILENLMAAGFSADNIAFGMGGGLLQQVNRDSLKFAMKCSALKVDGYWRDVFKDPVTDPGKRSKKGRLALVLEQGEYKTIRREDRHAEQEDLLKTVFRDGRILKLYNLNEIRARAGAEFEKVDEIKAVA
ncbi:nicotinate phosphoribosyltransferase [Aestuariispira insulae]|uniref:Nicotinamide phosphoribosyltransferase n=1 Tax=Aestuariispira insulae TaxID=1461337 RepID=A0A3D9HKA5_9PROT|nr:nicotinate phosphoribosyltransferase [Aestuariispira insulae]RED49929.1 nicotinamide phosphoribosyltransferase [Aestuariispira insulae]